MNESDSQAKIWIYQNSQCILHLQRATEVWWLNAIELQTFVSTLGILI